MSIPLNVILFVAEREKKMNPAVIIASLIFVTILLKIFVNVKNKKMYEALGQFPSHATLPFIGNLHLLRGFKKVKIRVFDDFLETEKIMENYDRLVFWIGPVPCLFLKKFQDIAAVLNQCHHRDTLNLLDEWAGTGILNAEYKEWRKSKKFLTPAFRPEMLAEYANIFNRSAFKLIDLLKPAAGQGKTVDVWDYVKYTNVDTILSNTLGKSIEDTGTDPKHYSDVIHEVFEDVSVHSTTIWLYPRILYLAYLKLTGRINMVNHLKDLPTEVIRDKLKLRNSKQMLPDEDHPSNTIIDSSLKKIPRDASFTEMRIRDETLHLILAGAETTALNVCFTLLMLAINQDIQQKVYEEVSQLMLTDDTLPAAMAINNLKYLEQCIKETSRAYSQIAFAVRRTHKDLTLSDNKIVPKNTFVVAALHLAHQDPELYDNPVKWDPEHFSDRAVSKRPKGSDLIFGYGPRNCLGSKYFLISSKTQIAHIIRNYHLSTEVKRLTKDDLKADLCVRSKIGYPIKLTRRH